MTFWLQELFERPIDSEYWKDLACHAEQFTEDYFYTVPYSDNDISNC